MSDEYAIGLIVALAIVVTFLYARMDAWAQTRGDAIVSGIVRGVPVSIAHRRFLIYARWTPAIGCLLGMMALVSIGWLLIGRNVSSEEVRLFAYLSAFLAALTTLAWLFITPVWYFHLLSVLRQAEAD
jgi:hypothetical protein